VIVTVIPVPLENVVGVNEREVGDTVDVRLVTATVADTVALVPNCSTRDVGELAVLYCRVGV